MNASFRAGGYEIEISGDGFMQSKDGLCASGSMNCIGFQVHYTDPIGTPDEAPKAKTMASVHLTKSQARAVASALLAAVESKRDVS